MNINSIFIGDVVKVNNSYSKVVKKNTNEGFHAWPIIHQSSH